ncbi:DUF317 domain-containing protein [Streptomyces sp. GZWMJZ-114]|uniref:DUF317 domain-containing protein n=1 Tax=Streptomyces sp. GZWMJZ-114 TaxID=2494734 RepID=UPI0010110300|nr:DUF317 domain-containing protein [Streptomyces sp. GZWMJZ-114]
MSTDFISPRCLAGPGDPRWATTPLREAAGWTARSSPDPSTHGTYTSPDRRTQLVHDVSGWTVAHTGRPREWFATFGFCTPVEIVAAVLDAVTDPDPVRRPDPVSPFEHAGWKPNRQGDGLASPDGTTEVVRLSDSGLATTVWDGPDFLWASYLHPHTPSHVAHAFASALTSPEAAPRAGHPRLPLHGLHNRSGLLRRTTRELTADALDRALAERVKTLADRRPPQPTPRATPPPPPRHGHRP